MEFGEQVMGKLARQRMERGTRSKNTTVRRKLAERSIAATWVGVVERTGEHIIVANSTGKAVRVRTIRRLPEEERWSNELITNIRATPRYPNPHKKPKEGEDRLEAPHDEELSPMTSDKAEIKRGTSDELSPPTSGPRDSAMRELKITKRILEKFGYSDGCEGCLHAEAGLSHRAHSATCRTRIYRELGEDEMERSASEKALELSLIHI